MALRKQTYSTYTSTGSSYQLILEVEETSTSTTNNTSNIKFRAYVTGAQGTSSYGDSLSMTVTVNGTTKSRTTKYNFSSVKTYYCNPTGTSGTVNAGSSDYYTISGIEHDSDGNKSISVSFTASGGSLFGSGSITKTFTLSTIPRKSTISYSGTSYSVTNASSGGGNSFVVTVTPKSSSFWNRVTYTIIPSSGTGGTLVNNEGNNHSSSFTSLLSNINILLNSPSASGIINAKVSTYSSGNQSGDYSGLIGEDEISINYSINLTYIQPNMSDVGITYGSSVAGVAYTAGYSYINVTFTPTISDAGTSFSSDSCIYLYNNNNTSAPVLLSTTSIGSMTSGTQKTVRVNFPASTSDYNFKYTIYLVDNRGGSRSNTYTSTNTIKGYKTPTISLTARRVSSASGTDQDTAGDYGYIVFTGVSPVSISGNSVNATAKYSGYVWDTTNNQYKTVNNVSVTSPTTPNNILLKENGYLTVTVTATDKFTSVSRSASISQALYPLDLYDNGSGSIGVGLGTMAQGGKVRIGNLSLDDTSGRVVIGASTQSTLPSSNIGVHDIRNVTLTPTHGDKGANFYFLGNGDTNNTRPSTDSAWWSLLHVKGWDGSYGAWEIAGNATNNDTTKTTPLYVRGGLNTSWGSWRKIYDSGNKPTASEVGAPTTTAFSNLKGRFNIMCYANSIVSTFSDGQITLTTAQLGCSGVKPVGILLTPEYSSDVTMHYMYDSSSTTNVIIKAWKNGTAYSGALRFFAVVFAGSWQSTLS